MILLGFHNVVEEFSSLHVFHDEKELVRGLDYFVELDDSGVTNQFKDMNLSRNTFDVCHINNLLFLQNLDCHFLPSREVHSRLNLPKSPLSQRLSCLFRCVPIT